MRLPLLFVILFSCLPALLPAQNPGPGDIAPDAVYIDMDEWYPFSEGLAAIKKGDKWAFIDTTGKIVIPWGKVVPVDPAPAFSQGRLIVKVGQGMGVADEKGNILTQKVYRRISGFQLNPQAEKVCLGIYGSQYETHYCLLNERGEEISRATWSGTEKNSAILEQFIIFQNLEKEADILLREDRIKVRDIIDNGIIYGFANAKGDLIIDFQFHNSSDFSEGLAAVARKNEFGEEIWGFIDASGKVVIDFKYSKKPGDFHFGRAKVYPKNPEDAGFLFAYINPQGEILLKVTSQDLLSSINLPYRLDRYNSVLASRRNQYTLIDSTLVPRQYPTDRIARAVNMPSISLKFQDYGFRQSQVAGVYGYATDRTTGKQVQGFGYVTRDGELMVPFLFRSRNENNGRDNIQQEFFSHRAKATLSADPKRTGYIDERGVFVILKKEESQW
ncbi:MAG: WG repeat-containing protein [Bacteroidetes bacterium]|nr:MAG: WG repeat-containing protein [Bacteroidota bacterium]